MEYLREAVITTAKSSLKATWEIMKIRATCYCQILLTVKSTELDQLLKFTVNLEKELSAVEDLTDTNTEATDSVCESERRKCLELDSDKNF